MDWFTNGWLIHKVEEADDAIPVCNGIADFCEVALVDGLPVKVLVWKERVVQRLGVYELERHDDALL